MTDGLQDTMDRRREDILIVAGETSADRYGAGLVRKLRAMKGPECPRFYGAGGDAMEQAGVEILCHVKHLASIGPREAIRRLPRYYESFRLLLRTCAKNPPSIAVLLDFPEFNLPLARRLKRFGVNVIYYVSPQLWAWRRGRIRTVKRFVDRMLVILPFEEEFYRSHGVRVDFVGHPLLEDFAPRCDREDFLAGLGLNPRRTTIALLPGSRRKEVDYILPAMLEASRRIRRVQPAQFLVSVAPDIEADQVSGIVADVLHGDEEARCFRVTRENARDILANSDFGFVKSGTSTLEAALVGTPFLIAYRISSLSWMLGNILVRSPFKGLVNLIAGEEIVPEYVQGRATPEMLSTAALDYLENPEKAGRMRERLAEVRDRLGARCASEAAAAVVGQYL